MTTFDHVALADSRIIAEYRDKAKFRAWIEINPRISQVDLEPALETIIGSYDVDTVNDELLNIIGRIVGVPRPILRIADYQVFGYLGNPSYTNYNIAPYIGGPDELQDAPMSNDLYRKLVKAKIARNISDGTYDSIILLTEFVLGFPVTALVDYGDMSFAMGFSQQPDDNTKFLIDNFDIIPRPQGVELRPFFILPTNIDAIEESSDMIYQYSNYTLPGDVL